MLVKAKWQIGYKGTLYLGGDTFELDGEEYHKYATDVEVLPVLDMPDFKPIGVKEMKDYKTKEVKKSKTKRIKKVLKTK